MARALPPGERLKGAIKSHHFWLVVAMLTIGTALHYSAQIRSIPETRFALTRHAMERVLFMLPITCAAFAFGMTGGLVTLVVAVLIMLPRVFFVSPYPGDAFVETVAVALVGALISWVVEMQEREKRLRQKALEDLRRSEAKLRFYVGQIIKAQEDERRRIARELHDDTAQALVILSRRLDALDAFREQLPEPVMQRLEELLDLTDETLQGVRRFSQDLRPPVLDDLGLVPALESLTANLLKDGIRAELKVLGDRRSLSPRVELILFRIAQEALRNVRKHAQASEVFVKMKFSDARVRITIEDDGKGFRTPKEMHSLAEVGKLGLMGMQERAQLMGGTLRIQSELGRGTTVVVDVPV